MPKKNFGYFPIEIPIEVEKSYRLRKEWSVLWLVAVMVGIMNNILFAKLNLEEKELKKKNIIDANKGG